MKTLEQIAVRTAYESRVLPSGLTVQLKALVIHFPLATPARLPPGSRYAHASDHSIPRSYLTKPLVDVDGAPAFGELAIVRYLEKAGWEGVWVDSYHSSKYRRLFWKDLPDRSEPFDLATVPHAHKLYNRICEINEGVGGFFDVLAWKDEVFVFIEYKGAGDRPNRNEARWIGSALRAGVSESALSFVLY